jgi:hypothetical protein
VPKPAVPKPDDAAVLIESVTNSVTVHELTVCTAAWTNVTVVGRHTADDSAAFNIARLFPTPVLVDRVEVELTELTMVAVAASVAGVLASGVAVEATFSHLEC